MIRVSRFTTLQLLLLAWLFICILGGLEMLLIYLFRPETIQSAKFYWLPLMRVTNGFVAIMLILYPGHHFLKGKRLSIQIIGYFSTMILFVLIYLAVSVAQFQIAFLSISVSTFLSGIGETIMTDLHHIASYYFFLLFIMLGKEYFEERASAVVKKKELESELSKTQLKVLQRQIQPHFLFNTLNNAVAIIDERKEVAQEILVDLGELLRLSMEMDFAQKITLANEIRILTSYLSIEKKRFEHQLEYTFQIEESCQKELVPPFLLQPIVENAIKHGFKGGVEKISIEITAVMDNPYLIITVSNNGAPIRNASNGIGLSNTRERLDNAYGNDFDLELKQVENKVVNTLKIRLNDYSNSNN